MYPKMASYCSYSHGRLMLMVNIVRHKTLTTLKSKNDEQNNQILLKRLKNLSVIGARKTLPPPNANEILNNHNEELPPRRLTLDKLSKLIKRYQSDPLIWNPSVLARIFRIPEDHCTRLAIYVRPMIHLNRNTGAGDEKLLETKFVVDVARLKSDDNYLVTYKRIVFPEHSQKLPKRALPEIEKDFDQ
jgi:hypothetical protein